MRICLAVVFGLWAAACGGGRENPPITGPDDPPQPTTLLIGVSQLRLEALGNTVELTARVFDQNGAEMLPAVVEWGSRDSNVARVGTGGRVTAVGNGSTTIRATAGDAADSVGIVVEQVGDSLIIVRHPVTLFGTGDTVQLTTTVLDPGGTPLETVDTEWSVTDPDVASISASGLVTAGTEGSTTVGVLAEGLTGSIVIRNTALALQRQTLSAHPACAVSNLSTAYCWDAGQGIAPTDPVSSEIGLVSVSTSISHACGLSGEGRAYCWSWPTTYRSFLGDGTTDRSERPVEVDASATFVYVSAGTEHSCALTADGKGYCWGSNSRGQVGDGTTEDRLSPTPVSGNLTFRLIDAGLGHSCGLTNGGAAYCWGFNFEGQIGDGSTVDRHLPTPVSGGFVFDDLTVGNRVSCGLTTIGETYCWGRNDQGQLGDGTQTNRAVPAKVVGGLTFSSINTGDDETCALATAGIPYCWGHLVPAVSSLEPVPFEPPVALQELAEGEGGLPCGLTLTAEVYCMVGGSEWEKADLDFAVARPH